MTKSPATIALEDQAGAWTKEIRSSFKAVTLTDESASILNRVGLACRDLNLCPHLSTDSISLWFWSAWNEPEKFLSNRCMHSTVMTEPGNNSCDSWDK